MRILILSQFCQPEPMFKAVPFARALRERGHNVEILTGFPNYPGGRVYPGYRVRLFQREMMDGIRVTRVPLFPSHDRSALRRIANYLSFGASAAVLGPWLVQRPDVIYVYNLVTLSWAWRLIRELRGCAVVLDVQDLWPESVFASKMMRSRLLERVLSAWCRRAYQSAEQLAVLSPGFKRHLIAQGVAPERIHVIYNWCEEHALDRFEDDRENLRRQTNFEGRFNVLFAGNMGKAQALGPVIEAAGLVRTRAPQVLITFVGGGVEVESLKRQAAGLDNVQFLPKCSRQEAAALACNADALLVHLRRDPLFAITIPSKTQAYLYAGKPILMGVEGDAADLVRQAQAGLCFTPENVEEIAATVVACSQLSPDARRTMGQNGKAFYERELSFARGIERFEELFAAATGFKRDATGMSFRHPERTR